MQGLSCEILGFIAAVDVHSKIALDCAVQPCSDVIGVVVAVANQTVGGALFRGASHTSGEGRSRDHSDCGAAGYFRNVRSYHMWSLSYILRAALSAGLSRQPADSVKLQFDLFRITEVR